MARRNSHPERITVRSLENVALRAITPLQAAKLVASGDAYPCTPIGGEIANWAERKDYGIRSIRLTVQASQGTSATVITRAEMEVNAFVKAGMMRSRTAGLSDERRAQIDAKRTERGERPLPDEDFVERATAKVDIWPTIFDERATTVGSARHRQASW
jgi:hypothetical protein